MTSVIQVAKVTMTLRYEPTKVLVDVPAGITSVDEASEVDLPVDAD